MARLRNLTTRRVFAGKIKRCASFWKRLKGLLGTKAIGPQEACWILPCASVHTFGMRYPIDVYFLDKKNRIVSIKKNLKPNRLAWGFPKAYSVIEMAAGRRRRAAVGDILKPEGLR